MRRDLETVAFLLFVPDAGRSREGLRAGGGRTRREMGGGSEDACCRNAVAAFLHSNGGQ